MVELLERDADYLVERPDLPHQVRMLPTVYGSLYTCAYGDPAAIPALLLTHGLLQSSACWRYQLEAFSRHVYTIVWDLPGHGHSYTLPEPLLVREQDLDTTPLTLWREGLQMVLRAYALPRVVLAGWSLGGIVIGTLLQELTKQQHSLPTELAGLILINTHIDLRFVTLTAAARRLIPLLSEQPALHPDVLPRFVRALVAPQRLLTPQEYQWLFTTNWHAYQRLPANLMPWLYGTTPHEEVKSLLAELRIPTLIVHGKQDQLVAMQTVSDLAGCFSAGVAQLAVIDRAGHSPFLECPEQFNELIRRFLQRLNTDDNEGALP